MYATPWLKIPGIWNHGLYSGHYSPVVLGSPMDVWDLWRDRRLTLNRETLEAAGILYREAPRTRMVFL